MIKLFTSAVGIFGLVFGTVSCAANFTCPPSIRVAQKIETVPESWSVNYADEKHWLDRVTFYDGPPRQLAALMYDEERDDGSKRAAIWRFGPRKGNEYWISCGYNRTTAVLAKMIPGQLTECRVVYDGQIASSAGLPHIESIECK